MWFFSSHNKVVELFSTGYVDAKVLAQVQKRDKTIKEKSLPGWQAPELQMAIADVWPFSALFSGTHFGRCWRNTSSRMSNLCLRTLKKKNK